MTFLSLKNVNLHTTKKWFNLERTKTQHGSMSNRYHLYMTSFLIDPVSLEQVIINVLHSKFASSIIIFSTYISILSDSIFSSDVFLFDKYFSHQKIFTTTFFIFFGFQYYLFYWVYLFKDLYIFSLIKLIFL